MRDHDGGGGGGQAYEISLQLLFPFWPPTYVIRLERSRFASGGWGFPPPIQRGNGSCRLPYSWLGNPPLSYQSPWHNVWATTEWKCQNILHLLVLSRMVRVGQLDCV